MGDDVDHKFLQQLAQRLQPGAISRVLANWGGHRQNQEWEQSMHTSNFPARPVDEADLQASVYEYQQAYHLWRDAPNQILRAQARLRLQQAQEHFWGQIADALFDVAKGWCVSAIGQELAPAGTASSRSTDTLESLAMSMYLYVIEALPKLEVDPKQNLRACLMQIARRRLIDEDRRRKRNSFGHSKPAPEPTSGSSASAMWLTRIRASGLALGDTNEPEIIDASSQDYADAIASRIDRDALIATVHDFWRATLPPDDQRIMQRWEHEPPTTFRDLAAQLGPGWSESMIRQRHYRIMQRTRAYLNEQGIHEASP